MPELSAPIREFLWEISRTEKKTESGEKLKISTLLKQVTSGYEKIRNALEYKEEHLLRKNAIKRYLKRLFLFRQKDKIAQLLVEELIRAGYLPNETLPVTRVEEAHKVIMKYRHLRERITITYSFTKSQKYFDWFLSIAACEIEEILNPNQTDEALINLMYRTVQEDFEIEGRGGDEMSLEIYLECRKALLKPDRDLLHFALVKYYFPEWFGDYDSVIEKLLLRLPQIHEKYNELIDNKKSYKYQYHFKRHKIAFSVLRGLVLKNKAKLKEIFSDPDELKEKITDVCLDNYQRIRKRLARGAFRAIIFIIFTKLFLAFLLELPFDKYIIGYINYLPLAINVLLPPLLLFFVALTVKKPGEANTKKIIVGIYSIVFNGNLLSSPHKIKFVKIGSVFKNIVFYTIYAFTFIVTFGLLIYLLYHLDFNVVSGILFFLFLSLVSFLGIRIRRNAQEFSWYEPKDNLLRFFWLFFSVPIIRAGQWLSMEFQKINFIVLFLDLIIETPLKTLVELWEGWASFIKEKREEIM